MTEGKEEIFLEDECIDNLSDVLVEFEHSSEEDSIRLEENLGDAEY